MADPVVIGYGQNKFIKDANTQALGLTASDGTTANPRAFENKGTDYQVPVGKKFVILNISGTSYSAGTAGQEAEFDIYEHSSPDAAGGNRIARAFIGSYGGSFSFPTYIEISAGNYINLYNTSFGQAISNIMGVELDV